MLDLRPNPSRADVFRVLGHCFAASIILLKADVVREHQRSLGIVLIWLGLLFVLASLFHGRIESWFGIKGDSVLFLLEAGVMSVVAYELTAEHSHYIPYVYILAAVLYVIAAVIFPLRHRVHERP